MSPALEQLAIRSRDGAYVGLGFKGSHVLLYCIVLLAIMCNIVLPDCLKQPFTYTFFSPVFSVLLSSMRSFSGLKCFLRCQEEI